MTGGENLTTPAMSIKPGELLYSKNYEATIAGGYRRIDGFERYDGRGLPSASTYHAIPFITGSSLPVVGATITGITSSATGIVIDTYVETGSFGTSNATGYVIIRSITGTFTNGETLHTTVDIAVVDGVVVEKWSPTDAYYNTWIQAAIVGKRASITVVPGAGPIRGIHMHLGIVYAFRDNVGQTQCDCYKSTTTGWVSVPFCSKINFTVGKVGITHGCTITGVTSGATATVNTYKITSGSLASSNAVGTLYIDDVVGTFQNGEVLNVGGVASATTSSVASALTYAPGGKFEFQSYNFSGATGSIFMYGVSGVDMGFCFDGTCIYPIPTGMSDDKPTHLIAHLLHLFYAFPKGSLQHSAPGTPLVWSVVVGAGELSTGDGITGFFTIVGQALTVFNRNATYLLYGTSSLNWELKPHSYESGAIEWSIQGMPLPVYVDDRGLTTLSTTSSYGDFKLATISRPIDPLLRSKKALAVASIRVKDKNQYRLLMSDGTGIIGTLYNSKVIGFTRFSYGININTATSTEDSSGNEVLFLGGSNGYIYKVDSGTSFDGLAVEAVLRIPFNHLKSPRNQKRFRMTVLELDAPNQVNIYFTSEYSYGNADTPRELTRTYDVRTGGGYWEEDNWESFAWSGQAVGTAEAKMYGRGTNVGMTIRTEDIYVAPHTLQGMILHYTVNGLDY